MRQSLLRPNLVLGGERELVMASGMLAATLTLSVGSIPIAVIGVMFWLSSLAVFQRMAKADPLMSRVYIRHVNRRIYYPAASHFTAPEPELHPHQQA